MFSGLTTISTTFVFPLRRLAVVSFLIDSATLLPIIGYWFPHNALQFNYLDASQQPLLTVKHLTRVSNAIASVQAFSFTSCLCWALVLWLLAHTHSMSCLYAWNVVVCWCFVKLFCYFVWCESENSCVQTVCDVSLRTLVFRPCVMWVWELSCSDHVLGADYNVSFVHSGLWLCSVLGGWSDGSNVVWITNVHGKVRRTLWTLL